MNFTSFDKAILAAVLAPLTVLATTYVNGGTVGTKEIVAAVVAAVVAGVLVYLKGNLPTGNGPAPTKTN